MAEDGGDRRQGAGPAAFFSGGIRCALEEAFLAARAGLSRWLPLGRRYNVLRVELVGGLAEAETEILRLSGLGARPRPVGLMALLAVLRSAREDPDLGLVLVDVRRLTAGWSRIQTVRRALLALRGAGKRVWAFLPEPDTREYYLATAAERILLAPAALFDAVGLASEVVFLKGALDKLGIEAQLARAGRFKTAAEPFTRTDMSDDHRAMVNALVDDLYAQVVADIARARGLSEHAVRVAFESGPLLARAALERGLVDALAYPDQLDEELADRFGDPRTIEVERYQRRRAVAMRRAALRAARVGLLAVSGPLTLGDGIAGATAGRPASWPTFQRELAAMAHDPRLAAIVLRIDSPGGSGLASDLMWRAIVQARQLKPVLVSMGDLAASGGYYLAAGADHVTAEAGTLTGSIGVLAGKPVLRGLYERLGLTKEIVARGAAARHSDYVRLDEGGLARLREEAEAFYRDFVAKVAAGRRLSLQAVEAVAEGRVWTGRQASERGLVDAVGGVEESLDEVRRRLGLAPDARVAVERHPHRRALWQIALGWNLPTRALAAPLDVLAPMLAGERLLAAMPFLLEWVHPPGSESARALAAASPLAAGARLVDPPRALRVGAVVGALARRIGSSRRQPLVF